MRPVAVVHEALSGLRLGNIWLGQVLRGNGGRDIGSRSGRWKSTGQEQG